MAHAAGLAAPIVPTTYNTINATMDTSSGVMSGPRELTQ